MSGPGDETERCSVELSIIYVNWNSLDYLRKSIASVFRTTQDCSFEIIVVDNASTETGLESLEQLFPGISVLLSAENLGFARANNLGFRNSVGQYVLFLNPDTELTEPSIRVLLNACETLPHAGIVGCKLLNTDRSVQLSSIDTFPTILNQALDSEYLRRRWPNCNLWEIGPLFSRGEVPTAVDVISGACMLVRRDVFEEVGLFSEEYFMYAEDLDLNHKIRRAGFVNYYVGNTSIIHHGGKSSGNQALSQWSIVMKFYSIMQLFRKTRGKAYAQRYRIVMGFVACGRLMLLAAMWPFARLLSNSSSKTPSFKKWKTIVNLALGFKIETVQR
jgi:GT2 family glycosyltransferase